MNLDWDRWGPVIVVTGGVALIVTALAIIKIFYPVQSENLPWQPISMLIALGCGIRLGQLHRSKSAAIAYPVWGVVLAVVSGFVGMIYLTALNYISDINVYVNHSPLGVLVYVALAAQSFAVGGLAVDRLPRPPEAEGGRIEGVIHWVADRLGYKSKKKPAGKGIFGSMSEDKRTQIINTIITVMGTIIVAIITTLGTIIVAKR